MALFKQLKNNFFLISGPCAVESEKLCLEVAETLKKICEDLGIVYVFKASYKKANRSKLNSFTGIGDEKALSILAKVKKEIGVYTTTDIHTNEEVKMAADYVDILQIPAFLCRQTELLITAGETGKIVNIKKGQFLSADAMQFAADKVASTGNDNILLTERGNSFGYQELVVDFRNLPIMQGFGYPVVMDCTHSVQRPNQSVGVTSGTPQFIETMAKAAVANGVNGLFLETHPKPENALSDGANMLALSEMDSFLSRIVELRRAVEKIYR